jgi:hypothetical protein
MNIGKCKLLYSLSAMILIFMIIYIINVINVDDVLLSIV